MREYARGAPFPISRPATGADCFKAGQVTCRRSTNEEDAPSARQSGSLRFFAGNKLHFLPSLE